MNPAFSVDVIDSEELCMFNAAAGALLAVVLKALSATFAVFLLGPLSEHPCLLWVLLPPLRGVRCIIGTTLDAEPHPFPLRADRELLIRQFTKTALANSVARLRL